MEIHKYDLSKTLPPILSTLVQTFFEENYPDWFPTEQRQSDREDMLALEKKFQRGETLYVALEQKIKVIGILTAGRKDFQLSEQSNSVKVYTHVLEWLMTNPKGNGVASKLHEHFAQDSIPIAYEAALKNYFAMEMTCIYENNPMYQIAKKWGYMDAPPLFQAQWGKALIRPIKV